MYNLLNFNEFILFMKKLKKVEKNKIKCQTSPYWTRIFSFMDSIMENLPDVVMYILGYMSSTDSEDGNLKFKLLVNSSFKVNEEFVINQFVGYFSSVFTHEFLNNSTFEVSEFISDRLNDRRKYKEDIRGIYGIPVDSGKKFLGGAVFFSTKDPHELFEDKKSAALMAALAQSSCYSISYSEESRARELINNKLFVANKELSRVLEKRSSLVTITKKFRTIKSKGELFRVATVELSKLIIQRPIKLKIISKTRNNVYTECMAFNGKLKPVEDIEVINLLKLKKSSASLLRGNFTKKDIEKIYTLVKETRQYFVNNKNSKTVPAGIFPFRMGREVDGVLTIVNNQRLGVLTDSEITLINLFSQILGYSFLLLENLYRAKEETNHINNVIKFLNTVFKETIEVTSSGFELVPTLNRIAYISKTLSFSLEDNREFFATKIRSGNFELIKDKYIFSDVKRLEEKSVAVDKTEFNKFLVNVGEKIEDETTYDKYVVDYPFLKNFNFPIIFIPYGDVGDVSGFFFLSKINPKINFIEKNDYIFSTIQEQVRAVIESYKLQKSAEKKKVIEQQLKMARNIQQSFLPNEVPESSLIDFSAFSDPSKEVGGDFYDIVQYENGDTGFIIADVSGKGPAAALITVMLRTLVKYNGPNFSEINKLISFLNDAMADELDIYSFVTMTYLKISKDSKVEIVSCGHNPTHFYRKNDNSFEEIGTDYPPIGILKGTEYKITETTLDSGDIIMLYTDGIVEAADSRGEFFGEERLRESFKSSVNLELSEQLSFIKNKFKKYIGKCEPSDDVTVVLMKRNKLE